MPQDSNNGEIGSDAVGGASYLDRARAKASPLSPIGLWEEQALSALTGQYWETKLSLYGDTRRCGNPAARDQIQPNIKRSLLHPQCPSTDEEKFTG
jgi:hypothetical protein